MFDISSFYLYPHTKSTLMKVDKPLLEVIVELYTTT